MSLRSSKRTVRNLALCFALTGFVALALDATPSVVIDETEAEVETEIEKLAVGHTAAAVARAIPGPVFADRPAVHSIREAEILRTRNVTFRIDRPPPA